MLLRTTLLTLMLAGFTLGACSTSNPLYCEVAADCSQEPTDFCDIDGFYNAQGLTNTCVETPPGNPCNSVENGNCDADERCLPGTSASNPGTCVECLVDGNCGPDSTCDQLTNTCTATACTRDEEGDALCLRVDDEKPICGPDDTCVECVASTDCTSGLDNVHCDTAIGECGACVANNECASGACDFEGDLCVRAEKIVYVDGSIAASPASCGSSRATACKTIGEGITAANGDRNTLVIAAATYPEKLIFSSNTYVLVAEGVVTMDPTINATESALRVAGSANVTLHGITFDPMLQAPATDLVNCTGDTARLALHGVNVLGSSRLGVVVQDCDITIHRSTIEGNRGGGIKIDGSPLSIVNNFIVNNGEPGSNGSPNGGVSIANNQSKAMRFEFNTLVENGLDDDVPLGSAFSCSNSGLEAKNNIIVKGSGGGGGMNGAVVLALGCSFSHSLFDQDLPNGDGNRVDPPGFVAPGAGNYRITSDSACVNNADPMATEGVDHEGDARPVGMSDIGADEYVDPS